MNLSPIVEPEEILNKPGVLLFDVGGTPDSLTRFKTEHLRGAVFVDLDTRLSQKPADAAVGGRHPLPDIRTFARTLTELGISPDSHVVLYDDKNGSNAAARFWWMLRAVGHEKVQVLNGGLTYAKARNFPVEGGMQAGPRTEAADAQTGIGFQSDAESFRAGSKLAGRMQADAKAQGGMQMGSQSDVAPGSAAGVEALPYPVDHWRLPLADLNEVDLATQSVQHRIVDVRSKERYDGITEPIDLVAGHIPGAMNIPFTENLDENGRFLPAEQLYVTYQSLFDNIPSENVIIHCGSGVTACHTLLAVAHAGYSIPKLYVGSWSEWSRNDKPMIASKQIND